MKRFISFLLMLGVSYSCLAINHQTSQVFFKTAKYSLDDQAKITLDQLVQKTQKLHDYVIHVSGHTDAQGASDYNDELSKQRAQTVAYYLQEQGVPLNLIRMNSYGENQLQVPTKASQAHHKNRRVEVHLVDYTFQDLDELKQELQKKHTQSFQVDPNKTALIQGAKGTRVLVEPGSFTYTDGTPVTEPVEIKLMEALSKKDLISLGLGTMSNGRLLESGGTFKLEAQTVSGKAVALDRASPLTIAVPAQEVVQDMEIFTSDGGVDWAPTHRSISAPVDSFIQNMSLEELETAQGKLVKPQPPVYPSRPEEPQRPVRAGYYEHIKWYHVVHRRYKKNIARAKYRKDRIVYKNKVARFKKELRRHYSDVKWYYLEWAVYQKEMRAWKKEYRKYAIARLNKLDELGLVDEQVLNHYVFKATQLKWINIDRFYKSDMDDVFTVNVKDQDRLDEQVFLVFKEINSLLPLYKKSMTSTYSQDKVPTSAPAEIFAYRVKEGQAMMYHEALQKGQTYNLDFKPCKFDDIVAVLDRF